MNSTRDIEVSRHCVLVGQIVHTDTIGIFFRGDRFVVDRIQGPQAVGSNKLVAVSQVGCNPHMCVRGLLWATTSVNGWRAEVWACAPVKPCQHFGTGTMVEMNCGFDDFDVFLDMSGDRVAVASWTIKPWFNVA